MSRISGAYDHRVGILLQAGILPLGTVAETRRRPGEMGGVRAGFAALGIQALVGRGVLCWGVLAVSFSDHLTISM